MRLVNPNLKYKDSYLDLVKEAKKNGDINEMGNAYKENESLEQMIKRLKERSKGKNISKLDVPSSMKWIIENNEVVGTIDLRHLLNKSYFERLGHVAYYIHPLKRNKGYASKALALAIKWYKKMPINKILITCYSDNEASKKVILKNCGKFEKSVKDKISNKTINRYLIDISDTTFPRVAWFTTNRSCNCKCTWCYANDYKNKNLSMNYETAKQYIKILPKIGIRKVILIGGEPTIYKDIKKIIKAINKENINISMASNGIKFSDYKFAESLVNAGLKSANISLKGTSESEYLTNTKIYGLKKAINGYKNLKQLGINVSLSYVLCSNDNKKIDELYELMKENDLDNISFQLYKPSINSKDETNINDLVSMCEYVYNIFENSPFNYSLEMSLPLCLLPNKLLKNLIDKKRITTCCHIGKGSGIIFDTDFNILPCNHFLDISLNKEKVNPNQIIKFWNSTTAQTFRNKINTFPLEQCQKCNKWQICGGGCFLRWLNPSLKKYMNERR